MHFTFTSSVLTFDLVVLLSSMRWEEKTYQKLFRPVHGPSHLVQMKTSGLRL